MVQDREGNIVTEDEQIKTRWREYFEQLLNTENQRGILEQFDVVEGPEMALERVEVEKALKRMKLGKAGGPTELTSDMLLALGDEGVDWLTELLNKVWKEEEIPEDWKHSTLIRIFKGKGNILHCGDYRGIKLLEHMMEVYERIIDSRVREQVAVDEIQFGFMPGKGTTDATFILRQTQEKALEGNRELFIAFVDLEKAYDRVPREVIYWCLRKRGVSKKLGRVIKGLYQDSRTTVRCGAGFTESFPVNVCLHQGSVLSPFLFALVVDTVSESAKRPLPNDLLYADDLATVAESEEELQERLIQWQENLENKGLRVNSKKTEVMVSIKLGRKVKIMDRNDIELKQVDEFCYLGTVIEEKGGCSKSVRARIGKAWQKWREVTGIVCDKRMSLKTKAKIYRSVIRPVLLHGTESAALRREEERGLEVTEMRIYICRISLKEHRRNDDIRKLAGVVNIIEKAKED